jgi:hypothetical protein
MLTARADQAADLPEMEVVLTGFIFEGVVLAAFFTAAHLLRCASAIALRPAPLILRLVDFAFKLLFLAAGTSMLDSNVRAC